MDLMLADNIRTNRKARSLTQEQLAEVLGVTVGAVYKWEAGLSTPELSLIVEMADFFDTSIDALLGYAMKDNRLAATARRLHVCKDTQDPAGLSEAEKALKKYPHSFEIVHESAKLYVTFGVINSDPKLRKRGQELLMACVPLLSQNTDPHVSEATVFGEIAESYGFMGDWEKSVELLKEHNADGIYNSEIGYLLANNCDPDGDAIGYLSYGLILVISPFIKSLAGIITVLSARGEFKEAESLVHFGLDFLEHFRKGKKANYLDRIGAAWHVSLSYTLLKQKKTEEAGAALKKAFAIAAAFDAAPDYDTGNLRYIRINEVCKGYDSLGATARDAIDATVELIDDRAFTKFFKEIVKKEE